MKLPIDEVEALLLEINQGGIALEDAAKAWIEANREEVDGWVSRATGG